GGARKPSPPSPLLPVQRLPLSELCSRVHERMTAFLTREVQSRRLRSVQEQTKISLRVIQEALRRSKYGFTREDSRRRSCWPLTIILGSRNSRYLTMVAKIAWSSLFSTSLPSTTIPNSSTQDKLHIRFSPCTSNPHSPL